LLAKRTECLLGAQTRCPPSDTSLDLGCAAFTLSPASRSTLVFRDEPSRDEFFAVESEKISSTIECEAT